MQVPAIDPIPTPTEAGGDTGANGSQPSSDTGPITDDHGSDTLSPEEAIRCLGDPVTFALTYCIQSLDQWQRKVLADARTPGDSAIVGANGIGKTVIIAILVKFFLTRYKNCRVVLTSGVGHQLDMFEEHLSALLGLFPGWEIKRGANELWTSEVPAGSGLRNKAKWFTTERGGLAQGQHAVVSAKTYSTEETQQFVDEGGFIVLIRDESGEIPKDIKEAGDTYNAKWTFNFGNAALAMGWWYDCFTTHRDLYRIHEVTAYESSYWTREQIERRKKEWGENSDKFKKAILAQFVSAGLEALIPLAHINACVNIKIPNAHEGVFVGGLDLSAARGDGDECVLIYRLGNKVFLPIVFTGFTDEMAVVGEVIRCLKGRNPHQVKIKHVFADAGGLGGPMISRLIEVLADEKNGIAIHRINFGGSPISTGGKSQYANRGMEIWQNMGDEISGRRIILPKDDKLIGQLASRQFKRRSNGTRFLVSKPEQREIMTKLGMRASSPDRADALSLALLEPANLRSIQNAIRAGERPWQGYEVERNGLQGSEGKTEFGRTPNGTFLGR